MMIDIKTLVDYKQTLNIKHLCEVSNINYGSLAKKIWRHIQKPTTNELTPEQSKKLTEGLKKLKIQLLN